MAAFKDVKVTFCFDYSKDLNGRKYTSEALHKAVEDFNKSGTTIPLAVKTGNTHTEVGEVSKIDVDGTEVRFTANLKQAGSIESCETNNLEVLDINFIACSIVSGLPLYFQK